jgi:predicted amidohydrolase YtcJ
VGAPADLAAYPADPFSCEPGELPGLTPTATVLGGQFSYQEE